MLERIKQLNQREFTTEDVINMLLYSLIIVMPFIVVKGDYYSIQNMFMENAYKLPLQYHFGKMVFIYLVTIILIFISFKKGIKLNNYSKIALVYLGCYLIATIFSIDKVVSIFGNDFRYEGILMIGCYIFLFIVASNFLKINETLIKIVLISCCIMSIYTIVQFYGYDPVQKWLFGDILEQASMGLLRNRNVVGTYTALFIPISMGMYILKGKKFYLYTTIIIFSSLICSLTRAVWVGFICFSIVGFIFIKNNLSAKKRTLLLTLILSSIVVILNYTSPYDTVFGRVGLTINDGKNLSEDSGAGRIGIWKDALTCIKTNPILGSGPDTLKIKFDSMGLKQTKHIDKAHNEFLELWETGGIITLVSYIALISYIFKALLKRNKDDNIKIMIMIMISYIVQSFFSNSVILVAPIYWIILGGMVKYLNNNFT